MPDVLRAPQWIGPRQIAKRSGRSEDRWLIALAIGTAVLGTVTYSFMDARGRVLVAASCGVVVCLMSYVAVERLVRRSVGLRLLIVSYALQLVALASIAAFGLPFNPPYHSFQIDISESPIRSVAAILTVPVGALIAGLLWGFISHLAARPEATNRTEDLPARRRIYLIIAALAHLLYWPAGLDGSGIFGYVGRVLATGLVCAPFLAGYDSSRDRRLGALWLFTIVINAGIGIVAGIRAKAFIAAVLFAAGYISSMPKRKRLVVGVWAILCAVPVIQLSGALGVVRDRVGRGGLEIVEAERVSEVFSLLWREMFGKGENTEAVREHGVSRLLAWTNVVVPLMTPETVPYRGMDRFLDEAVDTFQVSSVSGSTPDDLYDAGLWNAPARQYGFTVNSYTSVEFTLAADGWSRGGAPIALLFSFVTALLLTAAEVAASRLHRFGRAASSILALPVAKAAFFDTNFIPLLPMLRGLALYTFVVAVVVVAVEIARHTVRTSSHRDLVISRNVRRG